MTALTAAVAMAVPLVAQVTHEASATTHQRNAQSLAALANQAVAAGDLTIPAAGSVEEVVDLLLAGVDGEGVFEGTVFRLDMLDAEDKAGAMRLLTLDSGILLYDPEQ